MNYYIDITTNRKCPIRGFVIRADSRYLYGVNFVLLGDEVRANVVEPTSVHRAAAEQIGAYFAGELREFDLPVQPVGTAFQQKVWAEMADISFGEIETYGDIAQKVGGINRARAVGQAANKNSIPVVIPCHRVVGSCGRLTGFAPGVATKYFLLSHEKGGVLW